MQCPYCGREMLQGGISAAKTLCWSPKPLKTLSEWSFQRKENVILAEPGILNPARVAAYRCAACKKIVIPYE